MQIRCARLECGFRVPPRYFIDKPRFNPGTCPRDGSSVVVVEDNQNSALSTHTVSLVHGGVVEVGSE